jgi:hypothetical protein
MFRTLFALALVATIRYAWLKKQEYEMKEEQDILMIRSLEEGIQKREMLISNLRLSVRVSNAQKKALIADRDEWRAKFIEAENMNPANDEGLLECY